MSRILFMGHQWLKIGTPYLQFTGPRPGWRSLPPHHRFIFRCLRKAWGGSTFSFLSTQSWATVWIWIELHSWGSSKGLRSRAVGGAMASSESEPEEDQAEVPEHVEKLACAFSSYPRLKEATVFDANGCILYVIYLDMIPRYPRIL